MPSFVRYRVDERAEGVEASGEEADEARRISR